MSSQEMLWQNMAKHVNIFLTTLTRDIFSEETVFFIQVCTQGLWALSLMFDSTVFVDFNVDEIYFKLFMDLPSSLLVSLCDCKNYTQNH